MRRNITFNSQGSACAGWLYVPEGLPEGQQAPAIVLAGALTSVKEIVLPLYAERFAAAGLVVLAFDYRYLGESEGTPRGQIFPYEQQEDIRNALSWLSLQPEVDGERMGAWGVSLGGAHVLYLAAYDRRIKAVVGVVPWLGTSDLLVQVMGRDWLQQYLGSLTQDRVARYQTGVVNYINAAAVDNGPGMMRGAGQYEFYAHAASTIAPNWHNQVTLESVEKIIEFDPTPSLHLVAPTPLLMIIAENDLALPASISLAAFEQAGEPRQWLALPCDHFDVYDQEPWLTQSVNAALEYFLKYLK
jgi:fermentation-respiration switch protein FrsA (DUF1100 family)